MSAKSFPDDTQPSLNERGSGNSSCGKFIEQQYGFLGIAQHLDTADKVVFFWCSIEGPVLPPPPPAAAQLTMLGNGRHSAALSPGPSMRHMIELSELLKA